MTNLIDAGRIGDDVEGHLVRHGRIFRRFLGHDSHCVSLGVEAGGVRYFVKYAVSDHGAASLRRGVAVNRALDHEALPSLIQIVEAVAGPLLVYEWVDGELLRPQKTQDVASAAVSETSARDRFRALPVRTIVAALDTVYDLHLRVAALGFIAVDFYDGCLIYDFATDRLRVVDLDEYRPWPFVLDAERLPGSTRFMAPEEFVRGALIDQRTNVFTLGRAALVLLGDGTSDPSAWKGSPEMLSVAVRATATEPRERYPTVASFVDAWRGATAGGERV